MVAIVVEVDRALKQVIGILDRMENPKWDALLATIGYTIETQTVQHFQEGAGPEGVWRPTKRGGAILILKGILKGSIESKLFGDNSVAIGSNVRYGKFHQEGTQRMVRRAFLGLTEGDKAELVEIIENYISDVVEGAGGKP